MTSAMEELIEKQVKEFVRILGTGPIALELIQRCLGASGVDMYYSLGYNEQRRDA